MCWSGRSTLVGADYGALGVLDQTGKKISLVSFKSAEGIKPSRMLRLFEQHGKSLNIDTFPAIGDILRDGKTMQLRRFAAAVRDQADL